MRHRDQERGDIPHLLLERPRQTATLPDPCRLSWLDAISFEAEVLPDVIHPVTPNWTSQIATVFAGNPPRAALTAYSLMNRLCLFPQAC